MKYLFKVVIPFLTYATLLSGCSSGTMIATEPMISRSMHTTAYPSATSAKYNIPEVPDGYIRLYIYRPQTFTGMMDNPVVSINGKLIGNPENPYENRFLPGAIFVLDTPGDIAQVSWVWAYVKNDKNKILSLSSKESRIWYLRWHIPPLNFPGERYLEVTPPETAVREIEPLRFTGYVRLTPP